ncbi:alpha-ribazole-5-phosphate synthase [Bhargavaea ullalensis]|uniref:Alpha-ribazole kinase n=1 Tax=Bhargavaea ullalensis TaxID=1265685 RepID=A0ABV2GBV2_9BACL
MRNSLRFGDGLIVTTDNSGGIGMKPEDPVRASDETVAYFSARVALLEQWAAGADPKAVIIHNFTGSGSWDAYSEGVRRAFFESGADAPPISGSTETNMDMVQSAVAVTMIGKTSRLADGAGENWFLYGRPLVGEAVLNERGKVARLDQVKKALDAGLASAVWPVGSGGLAREWERMTGRTLSQWPAGVDPAASAGPSTAVLVRIAPEAEKQAGEHFGEFFGRVK